MRANRVQFTSGARASNPPSAASIITGLGGNPHSGACRCPAHDDENPSLHVSQGAHGKVLLKCHAGCSQDQVITALRARGLWRGPSIFEQAEQLRERFHRMRADEIAMQQERLRRALAVLRASDSRLRYCIKPYLANRGIKQVPASARWLSVGKAIRLSKHYPELGMKHFPAMVFKVVRDGRTVGAHLTFLTRDSSAKLNIDNPRRMFGPIKGGFIELSKPDPDKPLIVAEGIETCLSAMELTDLPGIAAMTAGNMMHLDVPNSLEVIIFGDNDENGVGQKEAETLALKLVARGRVVRIAIAERPINWKRKSYDWNDEIRTLGRDSEGEAAA